MQPSQTTFSELGLSPPLVRGAAEQGISAPTPVQLAVIPAALEGRDVWASARTGSGKTAAFLLPVLEHLAKRRRTPAESVRALVLVPTRELGAQIGDVATALARHVPGRLRVVVLVGGVSKNPQLMALRGGADLVIATPGRLLDIEASGAIRLGDAELVVLDEADRLLSLGFAEELARVTERLSARAQRLLFSATFPPAVRTLAAALLTSPGRVEVDHRTPLTSVVADQRAIEVDARRRTTLLERLLAKDASPSFDQALVFVATGRGAEELAKALTRARISAAPLHGDLAQSARAQALSDFRDGRLRVLVATDLAARGIDVPALPLVVNYDLPRSAAAYLHRIGRTSRAGEVGAAISFVTAESAAHFRLIEKRHRLALPRERVAGLEPTDVEPTDAERREARPGDPGAPARDPHGGVKGKRKSKKDKARELAARGAKKT